MLLFFFLRTGTKILRATRNDRDRLATNTSRYDKQITSPLTLYIVWKLFSILKIVFIFIYLIWFSVFKGKRKQYRQHVLYFLNVLLFTWSFLFFFQFIRGSSSKLGSSDALYTYINIILPINVNIFILKAPTHSHSFNHFMAGIANLVQLTFSVLVQF